MGERDKAIADFNRALSLDPADALTLKERGNVYADAGDYDKALTDLDQANSIKPADPELLNSRCWTRALSGQSLEAALADCNEALRLEPNQASILDSRSLVHFKLGHFAEAIADADVAVASNPALSGSLYIRGLAKRRSGDNVGGERDVSAAKQMKPNIAEEYARYGISS